MKNLRSLLVAALVSISCFANATVLNFDDLSGSGSLAAANYGGISWGSEWMYYDSTQYPYTPKSGSTRAYNNDFNGVNDWFKFNSDVTFAGAYFAGQTYATVQYELYNNNSLVFTSGTISLTDVATFFSSGYAGLIDEVRLNVTNGYFVMDDLTFNNTGAKVPEPAPFILLAIGLTALVLRRRV